MNSPNDHDRIAELERDNSQLREALKHFVTYTAFEKDLHKAAERIRTRAENLFREAELLESIAPLLK